MTLHNPLHVTYLASSWLLWKLQSGQWKERKGTSMWLKESTTLGSSTLSLAVLGCVCSHGCARRQVPFLRHHRPSVLFCVFETSRPNSPGKSLSLCVPSSGMARMCHQTLFSYMDSEIQLWASQFHGKHLTHSAILPRSRMPRMKMLWKTNKGTFLIY